MTTFPQDPRPDAPDPAHDTDRAAPLQDPHPRRPGPDRLWVRIVLGMVLGVVTGLALSPSGFALIAPDAALALAPWIALPGTVFLALLQMVVIPLVVCSIVLGIAAAGDLDYLRRMGMRIIPYFIFTTVIAVSIGLLLVNVVKPGLMIDRAVVDSALSAAQGADTAPKTLEGLTIPQRIANLIPVNPSRAVLERDMLPVVVLAMILGVCVITLPRTATRPFTDLCGFGQSAAMVVIGWAMRIAPVAVFGLLCDITIRIGFTIVHSVSAYFFTVLAGLLAMMAVYLVIVAVAAGRSPLQFLKAVREVQALAFSTSSSAAVMPFSLQAAEGPLAVNPRISRFVIPLGATINMDGTALYQAAAALFLCQIFNIDLSAGQMVLLVFTTVGASIGTPAMPGVGIVVLATILAGIGVPLSGIGLILGVDRLLDMVRTTVNVTGDLTACTVMQRWMRRENI